VRALAATLALLAACDRPVAPDTVARLGRQEVKRAQFEAYLTKNLGEESPDLASEVKSQLFDQFLEEELLSRLAADQGLVRAGAGSRQAVAALLAKSPPAAPSDEDFRRYYAEHAGELARPERVHLAQILVDDRAAAERALAEVRAGKDFAEVAQRRSQEPSASRGGDQGVLSRSDLPPAFADTIFALAPGEVSPIVEADYGFHLFRVVERLPAETLSLEQARPLILPSLERDQTDRAIARFVDEARNTYNPVIYEKNLSFKYLGRYATP
jgi:peptidyl-prolyl cis-trans isomerase C/foldase protein PrsA